MWLAREGSLNALDDVLLQEIAELYGGLERRFDVKVVVLGGAGSSFSAGADLKNPPGRPRGASERERRWHTQVGQRACAAIAGCAAVTVARLHGHVYGGGLAIALACDFRVASADARFRFPEVELGAPLTWGAVPRLIHEIGAARARELVMLCAEFDATKAESTGLVHRVCAPDELDQTVHELAESACAKPDYAMQVSKDQFRVAGSRCGLGDDFDADLMDLAVSRGVVARWS
ncbi:hypothetical protein BAY60_29485 [Prauserella muralis]|uniref:Enoyl-CoA hydratase n=1 Tax=Prauserella muralis TaxID=588067 RepID=A0A2V4AHD6_9PSEU|nr:hypothetical protein BAY60_29485 [Prauserella muralis]